ncbi:hypothetical protein IAU59_000992 [Kwoniella sp. CBS 9459]
MTAPATPPPNLDPPFRGYIESTWDALLVFEAARRGMIPRVTRRLIERERGMVQSGAVFVFDEHESGIKRWTDGLVWSPSRILNNFLVYRETDKKTQPATPNKNSTSPPQHSPTSGQQHPRPHTASLGMSGQSYDSPQGLTIMQPSVMDTPPSQSTSSQHAGGIEPPPLGQGALARPRSASEGGASLDRQRERQLVGSLTNSYKFKEGGLVKKTMSVSVNGFAQHMVSYYSVEDVLAGKLRSPSTIPELQSLEISSEYLSKQNFRFPPLTEIGPDGVIRYRGEAEEPTSPLSPNSAYAFQGFPPPSSGSDYYDTSYPQMTSHAPRAVSPRNRSVTVPMPIPLPPHAQSFGGPTYVGSSSAGTNYYESPSTGYAPPIVRQSSNSSVHSATGPIRPGSSSRRYDPYSAGSATSPRSSGGMSFHNSHRRQSQPIPPENLYQAPSNANYDIKPNIYNYHPPSTAPSTFSAFYPPNQGPANVASPVPSPTAVSFAPPTHGYSTWQPVQGTNAGATSRLMPTSRTDPQFINPAPPSSSGSSSSGGRPGTMHTSQGLASSGSEHWAAHHQPTVSDPSWDANNNNTYAQSQQYVPTVHQPHDEWSRPNANAIA